jgi:hypothetical protein
MSVFQISQKTISDYNEICSEVVSIIQQSRKELTIFSSSCILSIITNKVKLSNYLQALVDRGITIKILVDGLDIILEKQIGNINNAARNHNPIQLEYSNELGNLDELTIISDGKYLFQLRFDNDNRLVATFSNE